jgi:hypothetical protein
MIQTHSQRVQAANTGQMAAALPSESRARVLMDTVPFILGRITGYTALPAPEVNRWIYTWTQANVGTTARYIFSVPSPEPWYYGEALNVTEAANTTTFIGPNVDPGNVPAGLNLMPVAVGMYVLLFPGRRENGSPIWLFAVENAFDGTC